MIIQLQHVTKYYTPGGDLPALKAGASEAGKAPPGFAGSPAVDDLNMEVAEGEIVGVIGHNGAGKSTTLKMIAGLLEPTRGSIRVMGYEIGASGRRARNAIAVKRQTGYLAEESPLYENLSARQYLHFFAELYGLPRRKTQERIDALLESLNLPEQDKLTGEYSKGMKRKTAIARALLHDPRLLILDEPNSGLDPLTSFFVINYLKSLKSQGKTILISAHNLFHVEYICDRVAIIKGGKLVVFDRIEAIRQSLGQREYQVSFKTAPDDLPNLPQFSLNRLNGNLDGRLAGIDHPVGGGRSPDEPLYSFHSHDISCIAALLEAISMHNATAERPWTLIDLSVKESALEEIYVKLMAEDKAR